MYGKLFTSMYDGTLRVNWKALVTFQQMICLCDAVGVIDMTPEAIHGRTGIPLDIIQAGIEHLEAPDPGSRTPDMEGRRIERLDHHRPWGWRIVNHQKYRDLMNQEEKREADRVRIANKRALAKQEQMSLDVADCRGESHNVADVAHTEAHAHANNRQEIPVSGKPDPVLKLFHLWREVYNHPRALLDPKRKKKIQAALKIGYSVAELEKAIRGYKFSKFHMGENDRNTPYDGLDVILRDAEHIDRGIQLWENRPRGGDGTTPPDDPRQQGVNRNVHY